MSILGKQRALWNTIPEGTIALFFIQVVSTLSFSVLYSTLVLYMKGKLGLQVTTANSIMGVFIAFNFALHLLGGFWGGRLLSNRSLFCVGMIAQVVGCILLSIGGINYLYYGLAAFLTGSGLNVTCLNCMLTQRFSPNDTRRETAFLWNYAGMNIGFFIGFSLSGVFQITQNYQRLFLLSSLGNLFALLICLYCWNQLADKETTYSRKDKHSQKKATALGVGFIIVLPFLLSQMLQYADWANKLVIATGICMLALTFYIAYQQPTKEAKDKILAFAILMIVGAIFWMLYQIGPMGLTVFIDHNVQREYGNWIIPPQWFQNINTVAIVIGGPLLGVLFSRMRTKGVQINIPTQFALALFCIGLAFAILPLGIVYASSTGMVNPGWIVASFVLQSIGELLISPIGYAMIGYLAPTSLQGVMMGMWMLITGVGATLSSYSSNLMIVGQNSTSALLTNTGYSRVFLCLGLFAIGSSFILLMLVPKLRKLIQEKKHEFVKDTNVNVTERVTVFE
ncbi:peptide MFS transporter [Legionella quateirensis]|uniref:Peptide transport protein, POT family n=1 Tax=Legionella quateirensis TaxID=45072 RepID=A0A378KTA9_9GAMM|nr:oligopeptide:H+ symporter [Legionella quateirensis]KTD50931.1 peptide transport protein, POT family [Legionella quateirensis]STY17823.1 peptide transport protein, POT family [Legionella quateirensis]